MSVAIGPGLIKTTLTLLVRNACKHIQRTFGIPVLLWCHISLTRWHTQSCVNSDALQGAAHNVERQRRYSSWQLHLHQEDPTHWQRTQIVKLMDRQINTVYADKQKVKKQKRFVQQLRL
jgi:hypothetical protein